MNDLDSLIENEELHQSTLLQAKLYDKNNQIVLAVTHSGLIKENHFKNKSKLYAFLKHQTLVDVWEMVEEGGQVRYWYKNKYDDLVIASTLLELDRGYISNLPNYYYGYVIKDISQKGKITAYVLKQYNWFWRVNGVRRYANHILPDFIRDFQSLKKNWE